MGKVKVTKRTIPAKELALKSGKILDVIEEHVWHRVYMARIRKANNVR